MIEFAFWLSVLLVAYVYAGYPALLWLLSRSNKSVGNHGSSATEPSWPHVSMLISAFNEEQCIEAKIRNTLNLEYPRDRLEVIVVSDASDDATDQIVSSFSGEGIRLLRMPDRGGKTLGLNAGVAEATGQIIVFSDANALYLETSLKGLAAPFADSKIGAVIGESAYEKPTTDSGKAESLYWRYETWIKGMESRIGSVVGGDGAIYAVRRELYVPMAADALSDFVNPLQVVKAGYRCVYETAALSFEEAADHYDKEYRRKVRIVNRAWRALWTMKDMLNPSRYGSFSLMLFSHKLMRWCVPFFLVGAFIANLALLKEHDFYLITLIAQLIFYGLALAGYAGRQSQQQSPLLRTPYYFCLVNVAACVGIFEALAGKNYVTWKTARADGS